MMKMSVSRCRAALAALALTATSLTAGCYVPVSDAEATESAAQIEQVASEALVEGRAAILKQLAHDIAAGELSAREIALVALIRQLETDGEVTAAEATVLDSALDASHLGDDLVAAEEFVHPEAPVSGSP